MIIFDPIQYSRLLMIMEYSLRFKNASLFWSFFNKVYLAYFSTY